MIPVSPSQFKMEILSKWFFPERSVLQPELRDTEIQLIRASWKKVEPNKGDHGVLVFQRLFEIAPHLRDVFPFGQDPTCPLFRSHALSVMNTVGIAMGLLDQSDQLVPVLKQLGKTHAFLELTAKEYQFVGESILWVLNKGLGEEFTPEVRTAWETAYGLIADTMQEGAKNQDQ